MGKHAKLSPSSASRWLACPGSVALCATVPEEPSSEYADEGIFAHDIAERAIRAVRDEGYATDVALNNLIGTESGCGRFQVDPAMVEHLKWYVRSCEERIAIADFALVESRVKAVPGKVWGTADFLCVVDDCLMVDDLKYGAGLAVSPIDNPQLSIYGLGALERIRTTEPKIYAKLKSVRLGISQPRCPGGGGAVQLELAELLAWKEEVLLPGVAATEDPEAPLVAGGHCRFCPARPTCPALRKKALEAAQDAFSDVTALTPAAEPPSVEGLTVEQLGKALAAIPAVKIWIAAIDEHAYKLANRGVAIPGHKVVRKRATRKWRDEKEAAEWLAFVLPEGASPHVAPKLLSPAQAEKLLGTKAKKILAPCITSPAAGTVLVADSDPRPAISAGEVFDVLESGDKEK